MAPAPASLAVLYSHLPLVDNSIANLFRLMKISIRIKRRSVRNGSNRLWGTSVNFLKNSACYRKKTTKMSTSVSHGGASHRHRTWIMRSMASSIYPPMWSLILVILTCLCNNFYWFCFRLFWRRILPHSVPSLQRLLHQRLQFDVPQCAGRPYSTLLRCVGHSLPCHSESLR